MIKISICSSIFRFFKQGRADLMHRFFYHNMVDFDKWFIKFFSGPTELPWSKMVAIAKEKIRGNEDWKCLRNFFDTLTRNQFWLYTFSDIYKLVCYCRALLLSATCFCILYCWMMNKKKLKYTLLTKCIYTFYNMLYKSPP